MMLLLRRASAGLIHYIHKKLGNRGGGKAISANSLPRKLNTFYIDCLVQDCSIFITNALEILKSCIKSSICSSSPRIIMPVRCVSSTNLSPKTFPPSKSDQSQYFCSVSRLVSRYTDVHVIYMATMTINKVKHKSGLHHRDNRSGNLLIYTCLGTVSQWDSRLVV